MLERATACLDSGARLSVRNASKRAARSKRLLHASFWNHGAGDLEIPPWAGQIAVAPPQDLPLRRDSTLNGSGVVAPEPEAKPETPFLDFLYPPQALAYLRRTSGQPTERWEKRNARRLPEGFVQATRRYGSTSASSKAEQSQEGKTEEKDSAGNLDFLGDGNPPVEETHALNKARDEKQQQQQGQATVGAIDTTEHSKGQSELAMDSDTSSSQAVQGLDESMGFAESPADFSETSTDKLLRLRTLLNRKPSVDDLERTRDDADRVWTAYESLSSEDREGVNLTRDTLRWMSRNPSDAAATHTAWLYRQIPKDEKTLDVYLGALQSFLRRKNYVLAVKLHKEALRNAECGPEISEALFKHMVEAAEWRLAMHTQQYHSSVYSNGNKDALADCVWGVLRGMPDLLERSYGLIRYMQRLEHAKTHDEHSRKFCVRFFRETVTHGVLTLHAGNIRDMATSIGVPRVRFRMLFTYIARYDNKALTFLADCLQKMLTQYPDETYTHLHQVVSYVYRKYVEMRKKPDPGIWMHFLERLIKYPRRLVDSKDSVSVEKLVRQYTSAYGELGTKAATLLIWYYARQGEVDRVNSYLKSLQSLKPNWIEYNRGLAATIYVHARRADVEKANAAFEYARQVTRANGQYVDAQSWNILIHAYSRADDLEGALKVLEQMRNANAKIDEYSIHPVMHMYAQRGDAEAVEELLVQYDRLADKKRTTAMLASRINAYTNNGDMERAENTLRDTLRAVRDGEVLGSMTGPFNTVLAAYALRRSIDDTLRVYTYMRTERIQRNANTFAALIQALTIYRRTDSAYSILCNVMWKEDVVPTAFHYALCMIGFTNQAMYAQALKVQHRMLNDKIKPTFSSRMAYLKARALYEHAQSGKYENMQPEPLPLEDTITELQGMLPSMSGADFASKDPQIGLGVSDMRSNTPGAYFEFIIFLHGKRRCFEAVQALYQSYATTAGNPGSIPLRLLTALMSAYWRAGEHEEVDRLWQLAKAQANKLAQTVPVPDLSTIPDDSSRQPDLIELEAPRSQEATPAPMSPTNPKLDPVAPIRPTASMRKHILSRPLRYQMASLANQSRIPDLIKTVTSLLARGYVLDNGTWNAFIEHLCRASTPLTLLAFTLTERFLIPDWPGWRRRPGKRLLKSTKDFPPKPSVKFDGMEHIKASYLRPGQLAPQYRTLVWLGSALLGLRHRETVGPGEEEEGGKGMSKYVGTTRSIREKAPKTLYVVQSMPTIDDKIQRRLLRRE